MTTDAESLPGASLSCDVPGTDRTGRDGTQDSCFPA
jgi:hypothetical protein